MSIHIIRADLSQLPFYVDFIVNTANPEPKVGNGLDKYIYEKAGPKMLEVRKQITFVKETAKRCSFRTCNAL